MSEIHTILIHLHTRSKRPQKLILGPLLFFQNISLVALNVMAEVCESCQDGSDNDKALIYSCETLERSLNFDLMSWMSGVAYEVYCTQLLRANELLKPR